MVIPGFKGMGLKDFGKTFFTEVMKNDLIDIAAELAYYFLFAIFPLLFCLVAITAYLPLGDAVNDLLSRLAMIMPKEAMGIIQGQLTGLLNNPHPKLLSLGLIIALWSASRGIDSLRNGLNFAYDVKETRPWWRVQLMALGMTVAGSLLLLVAFSLIILGGKLGFFIADHIGMGRVFMFSWSWLRWPISALVIMLMLALCYYFLPSAKQEFKFITPGAVLATLLWIGSTWGFTVYAEHFGNYNAMYGSIGGVVVLMTWLYLSGLIFLLGGEMNAIIEHHSADGKDKGAKAAGEAPAPKSERPSAAPRGETQAPGVDSLTTP